MRRRHRDEKPVFAARGAVTRAVVGLSDSPDYWPLTVEPTASRRKRSVSTWMFLGVIVALGAGLLLVLQPDMPTW
jgi:hypothetical protein